MASTKGEKQSPEKLQRHRRAPANRRAYQVMGAGLGRADMFPMYTIPRCEGKKKRYGSTRFPR